METRILLLVLIVSAVLFAGCIGGNQNAQTAQPGGNGGNTQPSGGGTQAVSNASANASANASNQQVANASNQQLGTSVADQLSALFAGAGEPNYKVTYTYSAGQGTAPATMVQYKKGDKMRMDTSMELSGMGTLSSEVFMLDNKTYVCSDYAGQGNFTCMKLASSTQGNEVPTASTLNESASIDNTQLLAPTVIAGIPATCFRVTSPAEGDTPASSADYCVSSDGILLSMSSSAVTLTATAVEKGISDNAFVLPAQPTEVPTS